MQFPIFRSTVFCFLRGYQKNIKNSTPTWLCVYLLVPRTWLARSFFNCNSNETSFKNCSKNSMKSAGIPQFREHIYSVGLFGWKKTSENRRWVILATFFFQTCCFALKDARYWAAQQLRSDVECVGCTGIRQPNLYRQKKKLKRWRPAILWAVFLVLSIFNNLSWGARTKVKS